MRRPIVPRSLLCGLVLTLGVWGCSAPRPAPAIRPAGGNEIHIQGSDTMAFLGRRWAEEFMRNHPGVIVRVDGGGSRAGVEALIKGKTDLCASSRPLTSDETRRLLERTGSVGIEILIARDALSIYLNFANPVRDLSLDQVRGLLSGSIKNWRDVGGLDERVQVCVREPNSGTRAFLQEHVLQGDEYAITAATISGTWALADAVAHDRAGIGFGGLAFGNQVYHCRIDGVAPTPTNVRSSAYPIARYLYLYAAAPPEGAIKKFIDWVLGVEGQRIVEECGYVPIWGVDTHPRDSRSDP